MAERFRWTRRGYTAQLELPEVRLLRGLVRDVVALLEGRRADVRPAEADPAEAPAAEPGAEVASGTAEATTAAEAAEIAESTEPVAADDDEPTDPTSAQ